MKLSRKVIAAVILGLAGALGLRAFYEINKARVGTRVLFIGNSFTFVNNLPAVFAETPCRDCTAG